MPLPKLHRAPYLPMFVKGGVKLRGFENLALPRLAGAPVLF